MDQPVKPTHHRLARLAQGITSIRLLFLLAATGLAAGLASAYVSAEPVPSQPPAFSPSANPYADGIYANGIVESAQTPRRKYLDLPGSARPHHPADM